MGARIYAKLRAAFRAWEECALDCAIERAAAELEARAAGLDALRRRRSALGVERIVNGL